MIVCFLCFVLLGSSVALEESERLELRNEAEDMFFHAYNAYMQVAWPADELMPLSCKGRYRGREPGRGDIDEALGNFSLTLVDSLDMLVVLGRLDEFEDAVLKVVETVSFDSDIVVSVFETNIRIVGGLVSGHVLAEYVRDKHGRMSWYTGELLDMALDIGNRLLPAFNSTTGLPYPRVNLRTGLKGVNSIQLTCTACAGSMILEFAALSRLSGESIYEEKASKAMDYLWSVRHRQSNLVGNVLNVNTGDWVRRESGVGAGIDSYYEYVAKAYVLLGEEKYLDRWKTHYSAIMKYLNTGPLMADVHMHHPTTNSKHFTDALGAFWPGLQVLMGDLIPAIEQHEVLYQIMKKHSFLPEAITSDFQVHWGQHFLRPEFVESTYFLYKATKDPHYLEVGKKVLRALQKHARVTCGYAAVKDVRTMVLDDRMDSFVLSETFKYLYLLFSKEDELFLDMNQFVFTTEAHLLPLSLARLSNTTVVPVTEEFQNLLQTDEEVEFAQACPSTRYMFPEHTRTADAAASVRRPLGNIVEAAAPRQRVIKRRILAADFSSTDPDHIALVKQMGVNLMSLPDGRVQLLHTFANAESQEDAEEGLLFMQEMIELSKQTQQSQDSPPKQVRFSVGDKEVVLQAGPAQFGPSLTKGSEVTGRLVKAGDMKACIGGLQNGESMWGNIVLVERGDCMFIEKARVLQSLGAVGGIVMDTTEGSAAGASPIFAMSGDGSQDVSIPMVFLFMEEAKQLLQALSEDPSLNVRLEERPASQQQGLCMPKLKQDIAIETFMSILHETDTYWFNNNNQQCDFLQYILNVVLVPTSKPQNQPNIIHMPRNFRFIPIDIDKQLEQLQVELDEMKNHIIKAHFTSEFEYGSLAKEESISPDIQFNSIENVNIEEGTLGEAESLFRNIQFNSVENQNIEEVTLLEEEPTPKIWDKEKPEIEEIILDDNVIKEDIKDQCVDENSLPVELVLSEEIDEQIIDATKHSRNGLEIVPNSKAGDLFVEKASMEFINYASTGMCLLFNTGNGFTNINQSKHEEMGTDNLKQLIGNASTGITKSNIQEESDPSKQKITGRKLLSIQEDSFESLLGDIENLIEEIEAENKLESSEELNEIENLLEELDAENKLERSEEESKDALIDNESSVNSEVPVKGEEEFFEGNFDSQKILESDIKFASLSVDDPLISITSKEEDTSSEETSQDAILEGENFQNSEVSNEEVEHFVHDVVNEQNIAEISEANTVDDDQIRSSTNSDDNLLEDIVEEKTLEKNEEASEGILIDNTIVEDIGGANTVHDEPTRSTTSIEENLVADIEKEKELENSEEASEGIVTDNTIHLDSAATVDEAEETDNVLNDAPSYSDDNSLESSTNNDDSNVKETIKENSFESQDVEENLSLEIKEEKKLELCEDANRGSMIDNEDSLNSAVTDDEGEVFVETVDDEDDDLGSKTKTYFADTSIKGSIKKEKDDLIQPTNVKSKRYDVESELKALETQLSNNETSTLKKLKFINNYLHILSERDFDINSEQLEFYEEIILVVYNIFEETGLLVMDANNEADEKPNDNLAIFENVVGKIFPRFKSLSYFTRVCHWLINHFTTNQEYYDGKFNLLVQFSNDVIFNYHYAAQISEVILAEDDETEMYITAALIETVKEHQAFHEQVLLFKREMDRQQMQNLGDEGESIDISYLEAEEENAEVSVEEDSLEDVTVENEDKYEMKFSTSSFAVKNQDLAEGSCAKDDHDCKENNQNLYTEEENTEGKKTQHNEDIPIRIMPVSRKVSEEKNKETEKRNDQESKKSNSEKLSEKQDQKKKGKGAHSSHSPIVKRCYKVLEQLKKHAESESKEKPRTKKEEVDMIRRKVKRGVKAKELIVQYSKVHKEIQKAEHSDRTECANILNASKSYLTKLQAELSDTSWMGKLQMLAESGDMDLLDEVSQLIGVNH